MIVVKLNCHVLSFIAIIVSNKTTNQRKKILHSAIVIKYVDKFHWKNP